MQFAGGLNCPLCAVNTKQGSNGIDLEKQVSVELYLDSHASHSRYARVNLALYIFTLTELQITARYARTLTSVSSLVRGWT